MLSQRNIDKINRMITSELDEANRLSKTHEQKMQHIARANALMELISPKISEPVRTPQQDRIHDLLADVLRNF
jgi:hypothetical protein